MQTHDRRIACRGSLLVLRLALMAVAPGLALAQQPTSIAAYAGDSTAVTRLSDILATVRRANPELAAARALSRAAHARVAATTRPPDPQIQLGWMNYSLPNLAPMSTTGMTQLQVMQMLPLGGKLALAGHTATAQASASAERANDAAWNLRAQAAMAFYDLYATDRQLVVARQAVRLLQDIEKMAEAMYRVGQGRQTDVLRAQVEIAKMVEDTLRMQAMRQSMTARLNALLNRAADASLDSPELPAFPDSIPACERLETLALIDRPMIRAGVNDTEAANASRKLAAKELWPDLTVGVAYAQRGATDGMSGAERMGSLMVGASIPIFARDRQLAMRDEAGAMKQMADADLARMRAETRGKIGEASAELVRARNLARLYRTTVLPQAEATAASALSAYRVGTVDFMTLLDDRLTLNRYQQELYRLEADQGKAWAELEMLTGHELFDPDHIATASTIPQ